MLTALASAVSFAQFGGRETGQKDSFLVFSQHLRESSLHHQVYLETILKHIRTTLRVDR